MLLAVSMLVVTGEVLEMAKTGRLVFRLITGYSLYQTHDIDLDLLRIE